MPETVRIVGVPEHFNLPWHLAMEEGAFKKKGLDLNWTDVPEGTGRMCNMLQNGETDLAIVLTEGFVKAVSDGLDAVVVQEYIASPLQWGIHVAGDAPFRDPEELKGGRAAISRPGSGSHLMAFVNARNRGWDTDNLAFEVVHTLEGAVEALARERAHYFMWERFTTQPLVDSGVFRRVDVCPTPWPCFVLVAAGPLCRTRERTIYNILEVINPLTAGFKKIPDIDRTLSERYGQNLEAVRKWLSLTRWSQEQIDKEVIENVILTLNKLKLLSNNIEVGDLLMEP